MSFNFSLTRIFLLLAFLTVFWVLGGFSSALMGTRAWIRLTLMFIIGAISASLVDHEVGTMDRTNIRIVYLIIGVVPHDCLGPMDTGRWLT